ncbi:MAG: SDR family NAD(P)-dependent oxidoreductase [Chloroflexi bacterium]|nr:SDR family NAD(P)-dependent oxidoreductase [Chloroflexota bacterium]
MQGKKYLVTGGSGFIGSALVRELVRKGNAVRIFDNNSRGSRRRIQAVIDDVEFVEGDIRNKCEVEEACKGVDSVCHLAFVNGTKFFYTQPELVLDVGVKGIVNVIDACMKHGVGELILASSSEVYQTPPTVPTDEAAPLCIPDILNPRYSYAAGKIIGEAMALNYGRRHFQRVVVFRPHNVYGPDMGWEHVIPQFALRMKQLCQTAGDTVRFPVQGSGKETRAFVFIEDFIAGLGLILEHGEHLGIYHIGTMEEVTIEKLAHLVGDYFGRKVEVVPGEPAGGGTPRRCPDIAKLVKLGYGPQYNLHRGLPIALRWYDENAYLNPAE